MLTRNDAWYIKSKILHTESYNKEYIKALLECIEPTDKVIDVACGTGFPSFDLHGSGIKNITCVDADAETLEKYQGEFKEKHISTTVGLWQELPSYIHDLYNVLLCVDNSLVYLDSWSGDENLAKDEDQIFARIEQVVTNFYNLLKPDGKAIIGIAKNINRKNSIFKDISNTEYGDTLVRVERTQELNWDKRIKIATNKFFVNDREDITVVYKSYLMSKDELIDILKKVGFLRVEEVVTHSLLYDDLIISYK